MTVPTTQECVDSARAILESNLDQTSPLYDKAFLNALSVLIGMTKSELYLYGAERTRQMLALTATGDDLTTVAAEYGVIRKVAKKAVLSIRVYGDNSTPVPLSAVWRSRDNGMYYFLTQEYELDEYYVLMNVRAEYAGVEGDLAFGSILDISSTVPGLRDTASTHEVIERGAKEETDDELRVRLLDEIQTVGGGSNTADYRTWGQRTPNVYRVDPYSGSLPWVDSLPGERTLFVESTAAYDSEGVADDALLTSVRAYVSYNPDTGREQPCLGSSDDTLDILSITRNTAYFTVRGLTVPSTKLLGCQTAVTEALNRMTYAMRPFILGLDAEAFRNDVLSSAQASREVQRVVQAFGGYVSSVRTGLEYGVDLNAYPLNPGERLKAAVAYE